MKSILNTVSRLEKGFELLARLVQAAKPFLDGNQVEPDKRDKFAAEMTTCMAFIEKCKR